ncbi:MAG: hypothetical protein HY308_08615 [Gammaproteobacteria bacterium]|nr:hypothetical protein [Gammaproteobacteria bacterium]
MATDTTTTQNKQSKTNGQQANKSGKQPRVISHPNDVASVVMMQIDAVNTKKDELTIAAKGLADTAKQLVRAYAQQAAVIQKLQHKLAELEGKAEK